MSLWLLVGLAGLVALVGGAFLVGRGDRVRRREQEHAQAFDRSLSGRLLQQASDLDRLVATLGGLADEQHDVAVLARACDDAVRLIPDTRAALLVLRPDGTLEVAASAGLPAEGLAGVEVARVEDAATVLATAMGTPVAHATPLATRHELIAVLVVGRTLVSGAEHADAHLSPAEQAQLQVIADFAARTAHNARLQGHLERARVEAERRERERARLSDQLAHAEQGERRRLADLLHDGPQQTITSVSLMLDACVDAASDGDWDAMRRILSRARDRNRESIRDLRELGSSIEPPALRNGGLAEALEPLVVRLGEDHGVTVLVELAAAENLPAAVRAMVYPIVREALSNSLKHARASQITVAAERMEDGLAIVVADNGSGMLRTVAPDGLGQGTDGIRERAAALGGTVTWDPVPGGGTALRLVIPARVLPRAA